MMKWKVKKEEVYCGVLELGNLTVNADYMEVYIDILDMSEELKEEVNKAIEAAKVDLSKEIEDLNKEYNRNNNTVWCNKPVVMDFTCLDVILESEKPITYSIHFGFHDAEDRDIEEWGCSIPVDLSEYQEELRVAIIKVLTDKFFR